MKITKRQLKRIINEELRSINEIAPLVPVAAAAALPAASGTIIGLSAAGYAAVISMATITALALYFVTDKVLDELPAGAQKLYELLHPDVRTALEEMKAATQKLPWQLTGSANDAAVKLIVGILEKATDAITPPEETK